MIKMLIVDDERIIREGIRDIVDWQELGIEVVGIAADGLQAIEVYVKHQPQIVITDIRMPKMDGLELTRYLCKRNAGIKVIILSGHEEFSYAQEALKLGVEDYLLKPVVPDKLVERVLQILETCRAENKKKDEEQKLLQQIQESLPLLRDKFLWELASGNFNSKEDIAKRAEYLGISFKEPGSFCSIIIHIDDYKGILKVNSERDGQLLNKAIENAIKEIINDDGEVFALMSGEFCILMNMALESDSDEEARLRKKTETLQGALQSGWELSATIGIGRLCEDILSISDSFYEAQQALKYKLVLGKGQIIFLKDIEKSEISTSRHSDECERDIIFSVKNGDIANIHKYVERYFSMFLDKVEVEYVRWLCMKLLYAVSIGLADSGEKIKDIVSGREAAIWEGLSGLDTMKDVQEWLEALLTEIAEEIMYKSSSKNKPVIDKVIAYLNAHYDENLNLKKLSEDIFLSPNYICSLFKQEAGQNISDYLTMIRIEKAKELLKDHKLKLYEISNKLGFVDSRYFNKVFKRSTGMNLSDFRDKVLGE